ncbi:CAP domain-containing protein [Nocardia crassostreae]|uniref:CAP domain-containing protein n=1 Tax=Nocardia crassostreae TaxID=53428 RepID=UPI000832D085|nr:CAP domain-containing protein [Nocardia crassostreae]
MTFKSTALALAITASAGLFALPVASATPVTNCDVDAAALALSSEETEVFDKINDVRAENGLSKVTHSETLARPAEWASNDSAARGASPADHVDTLGRDIATRFTQCGVPSSSKIAEINFYGTNVEATDALNFWWNSAGHKAIMLDGQLDQVGVAVIYEGDLRHWTVTFANSGGAAEPPKAEPQKKETTVYRNNLTGAQHQAEFDSLLGQGYRLTQVRGYEVDGASRFVGIWEKNDGRAWEARHDLSEDAYCATANQLTAAGYTLVHAHYYQVGNEHRVAAIWNK